jgi:hypothetical protein
MKANQKSFEAFMVLCGGYYPDVASLRVKVPSTAQLILLKLWISSRRCNFVA